MAVYFSDCFSIVESIAYSFCFDNSHSLIKRLKEVSHSSLYKRLEQCNDKCVIRLFLVHCVLEAFDDGSFRVIEISSAECVT